MKRVLLTGATGFVGRHCLPRLAELGYQIHAVSSKRQPQIDGVACHAVDLLDAAQTRALLELVRPSHLLHLAWYTEPGLYWSSPENLKWLKAGQELALAFCDCGGRRALFVGSCAEYDWGGSGICSEETTPLLPRTVYGECKRDLFAAVEKLGRQREVSIAWARLFFLYGPFEHGERFVPSVIQSILDGQPALCTRGEHQRDYLYVEDAATALALLLDSELEGAVNIGSGRPEPVREVALRIGRKLGRSELVKIGSLSTPAGEPALIAADPRKLTAALRWSPKYDLDTGLDNTIAWRRRQWERQR